MVKYIEEDSSDKDSNKSKSGLKSKLSNNVSLLSTTATSGLNVSISSSIKGSATTSTSVTALPASPFNLKDLEDQDDRDLKRYQIQCELNNQGASDLVVDLFMSDISNKVFKENVLLAIALLEGGNSQVQKTMYDRLANEKNSEKFCKTFHDRIEIAQREIKNLNSFMSSDISDVTKIKASVSSSHPQLPKSSLKTPANVMDDFTNENNNNLFDDDQAKPQTLSRPTSSITEENTSVAIGMSNSNSSNAQNNLPEVSFNKCLNKGNVKLLSTSIENKQNIIFKIWLNSINLMKHYVAFNA